VKKKRLGGNFIKIDAARRIEFAFATDDAVRLALLSTPRYGDAVTVGYAGGSRII
jgi:hypothetical protein